MDYKSMSPGQKAVKTKGRDELVREGKMAAWTRKFGKDDAMNPYAVQNYDAPSTRGNPDWTRDELIVALDFYLEHRLRTPNKASREIKELSELLNRIGRKLFAGASGSETFRNENGVYMKLMNFRRMDPEYASRGRTGLTKGNRLEEPLWAEFAGDPDRCSRVARAIVANLGDLESTQDLEIDGDLQEAEEGRILTRIHLVRERNRQLVKKKRREALHRDGKLACEACGFNFASFYGDRGDGFMECHHMRAVSTLLPGQKTTLEDLVLVCANCHRMIHRSKPWLTIDQLRRLLK